MSGRTGFGSRTHAFVTYEVIVSIVRANRYRPGAEEGHIPGKGGKELTPLGSENDIDSHFVRD
jgi:hypothetical protein